MLSDASSLPTGGGLIFALLAYGAVSLFVTGPLVGERTIERSGWAETCQRALRAEIAETAPAPAFTPNLSCNAIFGMFGPDGRRLCARYGDQAFGLPLLDQLQDYQRQLRQAEERRLEAVIARSGSRCGCAATVVVQDQQRVSFAIHAASARAVTPPGVAALQEELMTALRSPRCASR